MTRDPKTARLITRAITQSSFKMRAISGGSPDVVNVAVTEDLGNGLYKAKRDHWPGELTVPVMPPQAKVPVPSRVLMMFEDGDPQRPYLYWPFGRVDEVRPGNFVAHELVWRFRSDWECSLGAAKSVNVPGAALDLTEQCEADFQYWEFVVQRADGVYVAVGPKSSNYNGNSYIMAYNFMTGEELWETSVEVYDAFPQLEYVPSLNAVFCSGFWVYTPDSGATYTYTEAPRLYDLDSGELIFGRDFVGGEDPDWPSPAVSLDMGGGGGSIFINDFRQRKWFLDQAAELVRYQLPYSDELAAQALFHERIVGLAGYQLGYGDDGLTQISGSIAYEGTPGSAGVLLENTAILYNWNYEFYEACDFNSKPVKAWVGFGYRRLAVGMEWNEPERYPTNPKRRSLLQTTGPAWEADYANPEYRYSPTATEYKQTEVDRIGLKIQVTNASGDVVEWERTWNQNDHTQVIIDDDPKDLATLKSEWEASVVAAARAYYQSVLGIPNPGGFRDASAWDLDLVYATLDGSPTLFSTQADLTTGPPGAEASGGWAIGLGSGITCTCSTPSRESVHLGNFEPHYNLFHGNRLATYATGVHGAASTSGQYDVNLYSARVTSTRTNGDRIVVNYTTPSNMDLHATGYWNARRWKGTYSGGEEDLAYLDEDQNGGFTLWVDDPSQFPNLAADSPDGTPNLWNWIVEEDCNGYSSTSITVGGDNLFTARSYHQILALASTVNTRVYKNAFITNTPDWQTTVVDVGLRVSYPATYGGYDVVDKQQFFDPITRSHSDTYFNRTVPGGFTFPNLDLCEDFDHKIARAYTGLPRGGKSAITVLREVDDALVEECTLEFGSDYNKFNSHGTSQYPYTNGTPGVNGLWVDRVQFDDPAAWDEGDHTTKVERYDWDGTLVYSHDVPGNPWEWIVVCGNDVASGEDFLLIQNLSTWDLHLYDETGFVRTYNTMTDRFYNGSFWIVDREIYYTQYGAEAADPIAAGQYTFAANKVIKL